MLVYCLCKKNGGKTTNICHHKLNNTNHRINVTYTDRITGMKRTDEVMVGAYVLYDFPNMDRNASISFAPGKGEPYLYIFTGKNDPYDTCPFAIDTKNTKTFDYSVSPASIVTTFIVDNRNQKMIKNICKHIDTSGCRL